MKQGFKMLQRFLKKTKAEKESQQSTQQFKICVFCKPRAARLYTKHIRRKLPVSQEGLWVFDLNWSWWASAGRGRLSNGVHRITTDSFARKGNRWPPTHNNAVNRKGEEKKSAQDVIRTEMFQVSPWWCASSCALKSEITRLYLTSQRLCSTLIGSK